MYSAAHTGRNPANLYPQEDGVVLFHYRRRGLRVIVDDSWPSVAPISHAETEEKAGWVIHRPYASCSRARCLSSKTKRSCLYALIHINYFTTWAVSSSRCLKIRFQCQLRGTFQTKITERSPPGRLASPSAHTATETETLPSSK